MDTRQLEYFVAVAEELHFSRAAARLFAVQSSVSAGIRALETELGTPLFERSSRRVELTSAGEALLPEARTILDALERARAATRDDGQLRGMVRVGIFSNLGHIGLPALFRDFHERHPLVDLRLTASPSGSTGLADDVRRGRIDVAFMGLPRHELVGVEGVELSRSPLVGLVWEGHPLASRTRVSLAELAGEPFVDSPAGFGNRIVVERALARAGLVRSVPTEVASLADVPDFVAAQLGIAIVPAIMVTPVEGIVVIPLDEDIEWTMSAITRVNPSPAASALRELMIEHFGSR